MADFFQQVSDAATSTYDAATGQDVSSKQDPLSLAWDMATSPFKSGDNFNKFLKSPLSGGLAFGPFGAGGAVALKALTPGAPGSPNGPASGQPTIDQTNQFALDQQLGQEKKQYASRSALNGAAGIVDPSGNPVGGGSLLGGASRTLLGS